MKTQLRIALILICAACSGCELDRIKYETTLIDKQANDLSKQLDGMAKEQQMIIYETNDIQKKIVEAGNVRREIAKQQSEIKRLEEKIKIEEKQLEEDLAYLSLYSDRKTQN